ncbi:threonylcarbamoyl-AMP synthase [Arthrobacter sp. MYb227]|uniref:L-threonylcarbamoyladenylate synthase n=1 Tax=Arthrobacter sp. MYb227 TaxID=1848601 RepID=UPI000CFE1765|nr:L-threonylcarbamoyladenylate synthase [Arthrobacter sp. MYb227]PQZ86181.1 threonylcarbamoyl-AMP synthase [Arthrobacter sp. MYb227]
MDSVTSRFDANDPATRTTGLQAAQGAISAQRCIVMPTDTVYGIAADAFSAQAVSTLLASKGRGRNMPPPVLIPSVQTMDGLAIDVPASARALADEFWPGALTLILHAQPSLTWDLGETRGTVALRVPDDEVALELLALTGPLAVSSANRTGQPAASTAQQAFDQLGESVEVYLEAGPRPVAGGQTLSSTIIDCTLTPPRVVRVGALGIEQLREIAPEILDINDASSDDASNGEGPVAPADAQAPNDAQPAATPSVEDIAPNLESHDADATDAADEATAANKAAGTNATS